MVKPLSSNIKVWKTLAFVASLLTLFFALCLFFLDISIPILLGVLFVYGTERTLKIYNIKFSKMSAIGKKIHITLIMLFWLSGLWLFAQYSIEALNSLEIDYNNLSQGNIKNIWYTLLHPNETHTETHNLLTFMPLQKLQYVLAEIPLILAHSVVIIPIIFVYYFYKSKSLKYALLHRSPIKYKSTIEKSFHTIQHELTQHFSNRLRAANAIIMMTAIGFYIIGIKGALLFAIVCGLLSTIPRLGMILSLIVCLFPASIQGDISIGGDTLFYLEMNTTYRIIFTSVVVICAFNINSFLTKKYFNRGNIQIDTLLDITLVFAAAKVLGIIGMIFIIPMYIVYKVVLEEFYKQLT